MPHLSKESYSGRLLRVDLTEGTTEREDFEAEKLREYVGGTGFGARLLHREVPPEVAWNDPRNRVIIATGPLGGTRLSGSGTFSLVSVGPMTGFAAATQANGFFGAFLRLSGLEGIVLQGAAPELCYLYIHDGEGELRPAGHLAGLDTWETEDAIRGELGYSKAQMSVYGIGPAGENQVRFAGVFGDKGHAAAHNGVGAVFGSKRLKAIAVARGQQKVPLADPEGLRRLVGPLFEHAREANGGILYQWGTGGFLSPIALTGQLPIKNYTTSLFPEHEQINGEYIRTHFQLTPNPCWACRMRHCHIVVVTEGPYSGFEGEEPEYECLSGLGSQLGISDAGAIVMLSNVVDWLGLDVNETGWVIGWAMECYEKGLLTNSDTDGLELTWGNVEAVRELLGRIVRRDGIGDLLAEGVKRASEELGPEAAAMGVYTMKGNTPRGHDHRGRWGELFDTVMSSIGTIEATFGGAHPEYIGLPPLANRFSPQEVVEAVAGYAGWHQFDDCLGVCRFLMTDSEGVVQAVNAATGWDMDLEEAIQVGRRIMNLMRAFNFRRGMTAEQDRPAPRYGSAPVDGPAQGHSILEHWPEMQREYYRLMGWDEHTGKPLFETLRRLGLDDLLGTL